MEEIVICPKVFISYSWSVKQRVKELADRLSANGVDVIIDFWSLQPGHDKYAFMEQSVNDKSISKVLVICDKSYCEKANSRSGGVGDETAIISPEIYGNVEQEKFIPVVFERDTSGKTYLPHFMASRIYIDLSTDDFYEDQYEVLLRNIHNRPHFIKPAIGKRPVWLDNETADYSSLRDIIKQLHNGTTDNLERIKRVFKRAENEIAEIFSGLSLNENLSKSDAMIDLIDNTKILRDLILAYLEEALLSKAFFSEVVTSLFENLYSVTHKDKPNNYANEYLTEVLEYLTWELFVCVTALCLHYEKYIALREILTYSYFVHNKYAVQIEPKNYSVFQANCEIIEHECKFKSDVPLQYTLPGLYTMQGRMLIQREKLPVFSMSALCNADLLLCQLFATMASIDLSNRWFPVTYIYFKSKQDMWAKLISKQQCEKLYSLFNVSTIEALKETIKKCDDRVNWQRHIGSDNLIKRITSNIHLQDIGKIN